MPSNDDGPEREINARFDVPAEWKGGVYANEVNVWHTPYEFTLDFAVTEPPEVDDPDDPQSPITIPNTVVARVRLPVGLISGVLQAVNASMTGYERSWGSIKVPERQGEAEEDA
ncbi:MAG: DUF3467 domain-containing protein [Gaiellaceae bacterium]